MLFQHFALQCQKKKRKKKKHSYNNDICRWNGNSFSRKFETRRNNELKKNNDIKKENLKKYLMNLPERQIIELR